VSQPHLLKGFGMFFKKNKQDHVEPMDFRESLSKLVQEARREHFSIYLIVDALNGEVEKLRTWAAINLPPDVRLP
jgi:hypothetical protein